MNRFSRSFVAVTLCLVAGDVAILVDEGLAVNGPPSAASEQFQAVAGGLGAGTALDMEECEKAFDPRIEDHCARDFWPVPGGKFICPYHASEVFELLDPAGVEPGASPVMP